MSKAASKLRDPKPRSEPKGQRVYIRRLRDGRYGVIEDNGQGKSRIRSGNCGSGGEDMTDGTWLTPAETEAIQHLPRGTPYLIRGVSHGQFSIARHYGGATWNGKSYTYNPVTDELIRDDVLKFVMRMRRKEKLAAKAAGVEEEGGLF